MHAVMWPSHWSRRGRVAASVVYAVVLCGLAALAVWCYTLLGWLAQWQSFVLQ